MPRVYLQVLDLARDVSKLGVKEIILEPRIVLRLDLPNNKSVAVKAAGRRALTHALSPVLHRFGLKPAQHVLIQVSSSIDYH